MINVATGGRVSLNQLLARGAATARHRRSTPVYGRPRAGDVRDSQADIAKAARLLGYEPIVPFAEGLRRTVEWAAAGRAGGEPADATLRLLGATA